MKAILKLIYSLLFFVLFTFFSCKEESEVAKKTQSDFSFENITIAEIQKGYENGDYTIAEITQKYLTRIDEIDNNGPELNSIIQVNPDALIIAEQLDLELKEGKSRGSLHGVPIVIKDNIGYTR